MKNILILGASGFIGKNIIENLLSDDINLILSGIDLSSLPESIKTNKGITLRPCKLKNIRYLKKIIEINNIDIVIHLVSTLIPLSGSIEFKKEMLDVIQPTFELLDYLSEKNQKIIFFSSGGTIYGEANTKIKENHKLEPITYYGYSKLIIEDYIRFLSRKGSLKYIILRPSNVFGNYQRIEAEQGFIAVLLGKIISNKPIEIWGDGMTIRDYIYVKDVAEIVNKIIKLNILNETINIGSGIGTSLLEIVEFLQIHIDKKIEIIFKDKRIVDLDKMILDVSKLMSLIDFSPTSIEQGIQLFMKELGIFKHEE